MERYEYEDAAGRQARILTSFSFEQYARSLRGHVRREGTARAVIFAVSKSTSVKDEEPILVFANEDGKYLDQRSVSGRHTFYRFPERSNGYGQALDSIVWVPHRDNGKAGYWGRSCPVFWKRHFANTDGVNVSVFYAGMSSETVGQSDFPMRMDGIYTDKYPYVYTTDPALVLTQELPTEYPAPPTPTDAGNGLLRTTFGRIWVNGVQCYVSHVGRGLGESHFGNAFPTWEFTSRQY